MVVWIHKNLIDPDSAVKLFMDPDPEADPANKNLEKNLDISNA